MKLNRNLEFENNALFWQKIDSLLSSSKVVIERVKGTAHPLYSNLIYPVDYGILQDTLSANSAGIVVFVGSERQYHVDTLIVAVDILKRDIEIKLLLGCNENEVLDVLAFLNQTDYQKTVIMYRGKNIPDWAESF